MIESPLIPLAIFGIGVLFALAVRSADAAPDSCGACGQPFLPARRMVPRPDLRICEQCIATGLQRLEDRRHASATAPSVAAGAGQDHCHCRVVPASDATIVVAVADAKVCRECLFTCQGLLRDPDPVLSYESGRRADRDRLISFVPRVLLIALILAVTLRSCAGE